MSVRVYCSARWASDHDLSTATSHTRPMWVVPSRADGRFICRFDRYRNRKLYQITRMASQREVRRNRTNRSKFETKRPLIGLGTAQVVHPREISVLSSRAETRFETLYSPTYTKKRPISMCTRGAHMESVTHMTCRKLRSHGSVQYRSRDIH